ncbi:zinc finger, CCHC-type containing protein [Tanacetum coccineum]
MAPHQSPYLQRALEKYNAFDMLKEPKLCSKSRLNRNCLKQSKHSMLANRRMPKISPPPKRDNPKKDYACYPCKEVGYWRRNFPSYHAELKKRKNASRASTSGT